MHDPRRAAGWGATYVSEASPAAHTRGGTQFPETGMANPDIYDPLGVPTKWTSTILKGRGNQVIMSGWQHLMNTSGVCIFAADGLNFRWVELMRAITGWDLNVDNLKQTGQRIGTMLHLFNLREGFNLSSFTMPERARGNPPLTAGPTKGVTLDFEGLKRQYFEAMGFNLESGKFRKEKLEELGLKGYFLNYFFFFFFKKILQQQQERGRPTRPPTTKGDSITRYDSLMGDLPLSSNLKLELK